jgi:sulfotransferase family protein
MSRATHAADPSQHPRGTSVNPYLFIVGAPRSGTRLLGRLVNAHPDIAVIHEARFVPGWFRHRRGVTHEGFVTPELVEKLAQFERFEQLEVEREQLEQLVAGREQLSYSAFVTGLFDLHGNALGKRLVADKSPRYVRNLPTLHELWPRARFVHLLRDGRDVALSVLSWKKVVERGELVANLPTWEEDHTTTVALWWERLVRLGREDGSALGPALYHELRYEELVADPAAECKSLCAFLDVPYDERMLRYHEGTEARRSRHASRPPTPGLRKWRAQMPPEEIKRFEASAGGLLEELGYPRAFPRIDANARRHAARMREVFSDAMREKSARLPRVW